MFFQEREFETNKEAVVVKETRLVFNFYLLNSFYLVLTAVVTVEEMQHGQVV